MPRTRLAHLSIAGAVAAAALGVLLALPAASSAQTGLCTPPVQNKVACENSKPGADPSAWTVEGSGDPSIQGFATQMSVTPGQTISFKIKSSTPNYKIRIFRLGYYGGKGARLIDGPLSPTGTSVQPACRQFPATGLIDCGNWAVSRTWTVPSDAVSGVYTAHLQRDDGGVDGDSGQSQIVFVVRDDASTSDIVLQTSDQTWQAYNTYGGNSLYICDAFCPPGNPRGYKAAFSVSYNRPLRTESDSEGSALFRGSEYSMIRFLEQNGYDVSYISGVDTHRRGNLVRNHDLFISSGHDEYWSKPQRTYVEAARDAGTNLAFFSGNLMFWKTRFEPSQDGSNTPDRTLTSYKDTHFDAPTDPVEWTGTWRDRRFSGTGDFEPENSVTGLSFLVNAGTTDITVPAEHGKLRMWRNTAAANLSSGSLRLAPSTLGYEWDVDADNGFRPDGLFHLSSTTAGGLDVFTDYGTTVKSNGTATHNMVMYKAPSGARVFNSGTVQWAWGLSEWNGTDSPVDRNMQQATLNLFADMGVQPRTRIATLAAATASTDTTRPTSTINALPASVADGTRITISGTAVDGGGGRVAGVEVSTDGGETWHPATGTTSWSYTWTAHGNPTATIKSRAVDDSANLETPGAGRQVGVSCPCSIWGSTVTPDVPDAGDGSAIEVGVKFRTSSYGEITGIRFYKSAANTGTHSGSLWTAGGQRLAQATFTNETASGWQTVTFAQPVEVVPGTTYVASYHAPNGHYAASPDYFYQDPAPGPNGGAITSGPPLSVVRNQGGTTNGVFSYGSSSSFPVNSYNAGNYWVDVSFRPIPAPGQVTGATATSGGRTSANVSWNAPSTGGTVTSYRVTPYIGATAQPAKIVTGTPPETRATVTGLTTGTTYTFRVQAVNARGAGPASAATGPVTPSAPVAPSAPLGVDAEPASQSARVTWSTPEGDGDSPITGYTITPMLGSAAQTPVQVDAAARSATVTGLTNGSAYTFRVAARNAVGTGAAATTAAVTPQATLFDFATPATPDSGDPDPVELGMKFKADFNGQITGVRFYKSAANTGTHTGNLWAATGGPPLASATFRNESASGWQSVTFDQPVNVTAGTTYVASYHTQTGHYAVELNGFASGLDRSPLEAIANGTSANGVFAYSASSTFPTGSYRASNYYVDVLYAMPKPGQVTGVTATPGRRSATVSWNAPAAGSPVTSYRITPYIGTTAQPARTVEGGPSTTSARIDGLTAGTAYTFTVAAANANGAGPASAPSAAITPLQAIVPAAPTEVVARPASGSVRLSWREPAGDSGAGLTHYTVTPYVDGVAQATRQVAPTDTTATIGGLENGTGYTFRVTATNDMGTSPASAASAEVTPRMTLFDFATPATPDGGDGSQIEVGVKFQSDVNGSVMGVRFYKSEANVGPHRGSLWGPGGGRLADATFTNETASGWQTVLFSQPVEITAGATYTASYHTASGHYSVNGSGLQSAVVNGPLRTLSDLVSQNGVYAYGESRFPTSGFNATNYWVDVLFEAAPKPAQVTNVTATAGRGSATVSWSAPSGGGTPTSYEVIPYIGGTAQPARIVSGSPPATTTTFEELTPGTAYTFRVRARNANGDGPLSAASAPVTPTAPAVPGTPTDVVAKPATQRAEITWTPAAGEAASGYVVTPYAGATAQTPVQVSGGSTTRAVVTGLGNGTSYTFRVAARNGAGSSAQSAPSAAVTPRATIFDFAAPALVDAGDPSSVELGMKFNSDIAGQVLGIRFYKAATNTGTHVGSLWSTGGDRLRMVTFAGETASGWQTAYFDQPYDITPGTTYVASYFAPNGRYSATGNGFAAAVHNPPLHALSNAADANGVYRYTGSSEFPAATYGASNYWVDVVFAPAGS